jgi:hypothetical protein
MLLGYEWVEGNVNNILGRLDADENVQKVGESSQ